MSKAKKALITRMGGLACVKKMGKKHMARIGAIGGRQKKLKAA